MPENRRDEQLKLQITKEARMILAGALAGAICGALASLFYYRRKASRAPSSVAATKAAATRQEISWQRLGSLTWAVVGVVRQIIELAKEE